MTGETDEAVAVFNTLALLAINARDDARAGTLSNHRRLELADTLEQLARQIRESLRRPEPPRLPPFSASGPG